jgi:hypothetical protein
MHQMPGSKVVSLAKRKKWILGGLLLGLIILVGARYAQQQIFQNDHGPTQITRPATSQPFDERLSLRMPVAFGPPTEFPLEKLPVEARGKVQKMTQRTAYFNGVYIVVMKMTNIPGTKGNVEDILYKAFSKNSKAPSPNIMPKIKSTNVKGVYESGAIRFPAVFGNKQGEMTAVVIKNETEDSFWCINAWGTGKAAALAEKTAREFLFN